MLDPRTIHTAWEAGSLYLFLNPSQRKIYDAYKGSRDANTKYVVNCSRKLGKSVLGLFLATETAIQKPASLIAYIAPTVDNIQQYIKQLMLVVFATCPEDKKPKALKNELRFSNGSKIIFRGVGKGVNDSYHNLRSFAFDLIILDEAAFSSNLDEIVDGALLSTLLPRKGNMLLLSTPPVTPDHAFKDYCDRAKMDGAYAEFTIRDSHYPLDQQDKFIKDLGGLTSAKVRREFFCEFVIDDEFQIVPEWKDTLYKKDVDYAADKNWKLWHKYLSLDPGWTDFSVCIFGYYNHSTMQLVVMGEVMMKSPEQTTDLLAEAIIAKEKALFNGLEIKKRISDNNAPSLLRDFLIRHKLYFQPVESKTRLDVMVSAVREMVKEGRIIVTPACTQLLGCLNNGVFTKTKGGQRGKEFARSKNFGHYDGLAALIYLVRELDVETNPLPALAGKDPETHYIPTKLLEADKGTVGEIISAGLDAAMNQNFNYQEHEGREDYD